MAQLTPEQQRVLNSILKIGRQKGASPKQIKAAIETGLVESGLRNLSGGDADSQGWRQERASLYANPTNLNASIARFFDETAAVKSQYGSAGALAAAVQRPAKEYRGRYQQRSGEAQALLGGAGSSAGSGGTSVGSKTTTTKTTPGVDNSAARRDLIVQYLAARHNPDALIALAAGLQGAKDTPATTSTSTKTTRDRASSGTAGKSKGRSPLLEMFWQGQNGINVKNGKKVPQGFVSGHTDHVHVAAGPKTVVELGKLAQRMGLNVGENPAFNGGKRVTGGHATNSYHYKNEAIDVSGDPRAMAHFAATVAHQYGLKVKG